MKYKVLATNVETGQRLIIEEEAKNKTQFLRDLRGSGFTCTDQKCKKADVYDWILDQNFYSRDQEKAIWYFNEIPKTDEEYFEKLKEFEQKIYVNRYMRKIRYQEAHNV